MYICPSRYIHIYIYTRSIYPYITYTAFLVSCQSLAANGCSRVPKLTMGKSDHDQIRSWNMFCWNTSQCPASNDASGRTGDAWQKVCSEASLHSSLTFVILFSDCFVPDLICHCGWDMCLRLLQNHAKRLDPEGPTSNHSSWEVGTPEPSESLNRFLTHLETTSWAEPCPWACARSSRPSVRQA